jgi:hypothetical protein
MEVTMDWFKDAPEMAEHIATVIALMVGGGWVLYQYVIRRSGETGLAITVKPRTACRDGNSRFVFLEVGLKNTGHRRLTASPNNQSQLQGEFERSIQFAGSLQLRSIDPAYSGPSTHVDWWDYGTSKMLRGLAVPEVNILREYTDPEDRVEFFMEPGESYRLGSTFILEPGVYLAKVVFVGKAKREYWSRIVPIRVE